jgi:arylsulfatase A-like enzyme
MTTVIRFFLIIFNVFITFFGLSQQYSDLSSDTTERNGSVLPFPGPPTASLTGETLQESIHKRRIYPNYLAKDAPNIIIVLMDDVGFGTASTFGGEVNTPTLSRCFNEGIAYNTFHTTSICSPSRAALLTGRNHTRVSSGTITERAVDWDGFTGVIPKEAATVAEVLKNYGYNTAAFGKWHNTPAGQTTAIGPYTYWPTSYGFEHFYGFLAGETSQWEPRLYLNTKPIEPKEHENYHLTTDLVDNAISWIEQQQTYAPDKPFLVYFAPGAAHGPHQIFKEWADKYVGKFDDGWDNYRQRVFDRQKSIGWIPSNTQLTQRDRTMASWENIPENQRAFQIRLMEIFAGFTEHADYEIGRLLDAVEVMGEKDNTLVIYIWGDNGSSAEGQNGSISELLAQNNIPNTIDQQLNALETLGGLDVLGSPLTDNIYHSGWAWAGCTPFKATKLVASHFGGTRNPLVISWPKGIVPDKTVRSQFHHVNDIAPTIYDILGITPPKVVNGFTQMPLDGISMKYTFSEPESEGRKKIQFFDNNGSRGIYNDGWFACSFGPLLPWIPAQPGLGKWNSRNDRWELYNIKEDFSQAIDLANVEPERLEYMKALFLEEAKANNDLPIGAGLWLRIHPEDAAFPARKNWIFNQRTVRMPEVAAPALGKRSNVTLVDLEVKENANGVLFAYGGQSGGISLFMEEGKLIFEYNMMILERYVYESNEPLTAGRHQIELRTNIPNPGFPGTIIIKVDGQEIGQLNLSKTVPGIFTASETFDVGTDLGSPVSLRYADKAPYAYDGIIHSVKVNMQ